MKKISYLGLALVSLAAAPLAHSSTWSETTKACVDTFIAENLDGRAATVRVNDYVAPMPLVLRAEMALQLTAVDKATGRTIATANCRAKRGVVTVTAR
jgi:hypothetical protein